MELIGFMDKPHLNAETFIFINKNIKKDVKSRVVHMDGEMFLVAFKGNATDDDLINKIKEQINLN